MEEKVEIKKNEAESLFKTEIKERVLAISTNFKTTITIVENGYF